MVYVNSNSFYEKSVSNLYQIEREYSITLEGLDFHGVKRPFIEYLLTALNFTIKLVKADDDTYGTLDEVTGKWSGIIGVLSRNEADMSARWLAITPIRSTAIKYSIPFINVEYKLFMKKPEPTPNWNTFLHVFDYKYWTTLTLAVLVCSICLFVANVTPWSSSADKRIIAYFPAIKKSIAITCRAMVTYDVQSIQGTQKGVKRSNHLIVFIICFFGMVNYYIYNGGLIATLMVQNYEMPIRKLEDFLVKPEYQILFKKGGSTEHYFSSSSEDHLQRLWTKIKADKSFIKSTDEAEKVIKSDSRKILFYPYSIFKYLYNSYPCEIIATHTSYNQEQWAFAFNNKSAYIKLFNYHISKGVELGLEAYANQKEIQCATIKEESFRPINYGDIFPAFVFASIGCVIAILLCIGEFIRAIMKQEH